MNEDPRATRRLAATPPMGWNSWDCYGTSVTEDEVLANAEFLARELRPHGWDTVVVDIQWYEPTARAGGYNEGAPLELDPYGRPQPAVNRFPSARDGDGFTRLAERVHALGLRFGLHVMRGIPRIAVDRRCPVLGTTFTAADIADVDDVCDWNTDNYGLDHRHPGAQRYYDGLVEMFAAWGVDFIKADDMLGPYHADDIEALHSAVRRCERDIVLSLSPGRQLSLVHAEHLGKHADMWRISDDLWDRWSDVHDQFERLARWAPYGGDGRWPDADMLPLGRIGLRAERGEPRDSALTWDEQRTLMTLWCIARSPLMFGGDLPTTDERTLELLTNDRVLEVLLHGRSPRQVMREGDVVVWVADKASTAGTTQQPGRFAALFNTGQQERVVDVPLASLGCPDASSGTELWTWKAFEIGAASLAATIPSHGAALFELI